MCFVLSFLHLKKKKRRVSWTEDTAVLDPSVPAGVEQSGLGFYFYKHRLCRQELAADTVSMLRENAGPKVSEDSVLSHVSVKRLLCFCAKPVPVRTAPDFPSLNKLRNLLT